MREENYVDADVDRHAAMFILEHRGIDPYTVWNVVGDEMMKIRAEEAARKRAATRARNAALKKALREGA